jgi:UDP-N-acetylglucosamine 2-epimerase (non-hydrolysing)
VILPLVHLVTSARPNLPKVASLWRALHEEGVAPVCLARILHTGQHHDQALFGQHLGDLDLPAPHVMLGVSGGSHAELTGRIMIACEAAWQRERPDLVVVVGDVDGTLAAAIAARKLRIPVAHLEAGLRGSDWTMAEEINRRAVDAISDLLWASSVEDAQNLLTSGHDPTRVRAVGNTMADTLLRTLPRTHARPLPGGLSRQAYGVLTLHRAENVDSRERLSAWLEAVEQVARRVPLAWPVHPRTRLRMEAFNLVLPPGVVALPPLGYLDFITVLDKSLFIASDSGGVQEEATVLDRPCLTLRETTERPLTVALQSSRLLEPEGLEAAVNEVLAGHWPHAAAVPLWDVEVGRRVREHLGEWFGSVSARARPDEAG